MFGSVTRVFGGATRHATSLQRPRGLHLLGTRYATKPSGRATINGNGIEADNDAARRVATSFEERGE